MKSMTTDELLNLLDANEDLNVIDVREDFEVEQGMIPALSIFRLAISRHAQRN